MIEIKLTHGAVMPTRGSEYSSGWDLVARGFSVLNNGIIQKPKWFEDRTQQHITINPGERILIRTGLHIKLPAPHFDNDTESEVYEIQIRSRSGLAAKHGIMVLNSPGTVDNDYRGDIGVILYNTSLRAYKLHCGDKIAQAVICPVKIPKEPDVIIVDEFTEDTNRSEDGFGSTGK